MCGADNCIRYNASTNSFRVYIPMGSWYRLVGEIPDVIDGKVIDLAKAKTLWFDAPPGEFGPFSEKFGKDFLEI